MKIIEGLPPRAKKGQFVAVDVEMFGQKENKLHRPHGQFACISVCQDEDTVYQLYDEKAVKDIIRLSKDGVLCGHNMLYDLRQLQRFAEIKPRFIWDTQLVEQSMCGGLYQSFSLKSLARRWLGEVMEKETRSEFEKATHMTKQMREYAAKDARLTRRIALCQKEAWSDDSGFRAYTLIDEPCIFPVLDMGGMRVDVGKWKATVTSFAQEAKRLEAALGFNSKSTQQCQVALGKAGLHVRSTGAEILESLRRDYPIADAILNARLYRDAVSKYGLRWLEDNVEADGKAYSSWHITGAKTGRMSSDNPNLQNIPQRKLPIYRTFFIASPGHVMMIDDAHQQEPCITAYETKDEELLRAIKSGEDLHYTVAQTIFGQFSKNDPKYKEKRSVGKAINLGMVYGLTEYGLSVRIGVPEEEASSYLQQYFSRFKDVFLWIGRERREANRVGYVRTASGRRMYINPYDKHWQNNAINSPIQGGAADMQKLWIRKFWENCHSMGIPYSMVAPVHDETVKDVPKEIRFETKKASDEAFQEAAEILFKGVPFTVEGEAGRTWAAKSLPEERIEEDEE